MQPSTARRTAQRTAPRRRRRTPSSTAAYALCDALSGRLLQSGDCSASRSAIRWSPSTATMASYQTALAESVLVQRAPHRAVPSRRKAASCHAERHEHREDSGGDQGLRRDDRSRVVPGIMQSTRSALELDWQGPYGPGSFSTLPERTDAGAVYAWVVEDGGKRSLVRIGATKVPQSRLGQYDTRVFEHIPALRVYVAYVTPSHKEALGSLLQQVYPERKEDLDWIEYRLERLLLEMHRRVHGTLPPGNFAHGSQREYLKSCALTEMPFSCSALPPADLGSATELFRQSKGTNKQKRIEKNRR